MKVIGKWPALVRPGAGEQLVKVAVALHATRFDPDGPVWSRCGR